MLKPNSKDHIMAKSKSQKGSMLTTKLAGMSRRSLLVVGAFVLVFAGFGTWYVQRSLASGTPCVAYHLYRGSNLTWCVKPLQYVLQHHGYGTCPSGYCDGIDGPVTQSAIIRFGDIYQLNNNGEVGKWTWQYLCRYARAATPTAANELGCNSTLSPSNYGYIY
jgi:hypothetical protein